MNNVQRSALVARPVAQLFDLIEAAEHYPQFLPWCDGARIVSRDDEMVSADIRVRFAGMHFEMRTRNPKRRPEFMAIHLERGPFKHFEGQWKLTPLGTVGCKIDFLLEWEFDSSLISRAAGPLFARAAGTLMDAFVERALTLPPPQEAPPAAPAAPPMVFPPAAASPPVPASVAAPQAAPEVPTPAAPAAAAAPEPMPQPPTGPLPEPLLPTAPQPATEARSEPAINLPPAPAA